MVRGSDSRLLWFKMRRHLEESRGKKKKETSTLKEKKIIKFSLIIHKRYSNPNTPLILVSQLVTWPHPSYPLMEKSVSVTL